MTQLNVAGKVNTRLSEVEAEDVLNLVPNEFKEDRYLEVGIRPWGVYYVLEDKPNYKVKKIVVNSDSRLSLQSHKHRSEHWIVVSGIATVEIHHGDDPSKWVYDIAPNESCFISIGNKHRLANYGKIPLVIVEVQVGEYTGEDDITRYEDDYNRVN